MRCILFPILLATSLFAADTIPKTPGETLTGSKVSVPDAMAGQAAVLIMGFSHGSDKAMKAWTERAEQEIAPTAIWDVVELEAAPRLVRGMIKSGIRGSTPKARQNRFVLVFQSEKELKKVAGFSAADDAYLLVVNARGEVVWTYHGSVSDAAARDLKSAFEKATGARH